MYPYILFIYIYVVISISDSFTNMVPLIGKSLWAEIHFRSLTFFLDVIYLINSKIKYKGLSYEYYLKKSYAT